MRNLANVIEREENRGYLQSKNSRLYTDSYEQVIKAICCQVDIRSFQIVIYKLSNTQMRFFVNNMNYSKLQMITRAVGSCFRISGMKLISNTGAKIRVHNFRNCTEVQCKNTVEWINRATGMYAVYKFKSKPSVEIMLKLIYQYGNTDTDIYTMRFIETAQGAVMRKANSIYATGDAVAYIERLIYQTGVVCNIEYKYLQ